MCVAQRLTDRVHQRVIHNLHRQRHLRAARHFDALFQAIPETTARLVVGFLVVNVITRKLNHPNAYILRQLNGFAHNLQPLRPYRVIFATKREAPVGAEAHRGHPYPGFSNRID